MSKRTKHKLLKSCLAAAVALSTTLTPLAANADTSNVTRIGGYDKFETAALMAQKGWPGTSDNVVLSAGMNYNLVDALAAGPLAAKLNAPIILTDGGESLNSFAKAELQRLKPKKAYITSGTAVIKPAVINELIALGITPVPLGGYDQYETSVNIAQELAKQGVDISQVVLTGGWASPVDALSVSSIAAAQEMPILTTKQGQLPAVVKTYLDSIKAKVTDAYVIGGTAVVADAVTDQLPGKVSRYAGLTKYDTNVQVLKNFAKNYRNDKVYVANGESLVDALAGVPLAAADKSPVVLVSQQIDKATREFVKLNMSTDDMVVLGGEACVSAAGINAVTTAVNYAADNATVGSTDAANPLVLTDNVRITGNNVTMQNATTDYSIYVKGNNITLNNLTVKGTVFVDPGETGSATLDGVTAGNIVILSGAPHSVIITNSTSGQITISSEGNTNVVFNSVTTNGVTVQTYEVYETDEQGNQVKVGTITITCEAGSNLGAMTITSEPGQSAEVNLSGEFSQPINVEGQGGVAINAAAGTVISNITTSTNNLTLGGAGTYTEVVAQGGTVTAAQGTVLPSVTVAATTDTQTVTLAGNITNVTQNQGDITLAAGTTVTNMTTTSSCTIIVPPGSSIGNLESTGTAPSVGGGGTVNGETTPVTPGTPPSGGGGGGSTGGGGSSGPTTTALDTWMNDFTSKFNAVGVLTDRFSLGFANGSGTLTIINDTMKTQPVSSLYTTVIDKIRAGSITWDIWNTSNLETKLQDISFNNESFNNYLVNKLNGKPHSQAAINYLTNPDETNFNVLKNALLTNADSYSELVSVLNDMSLLQGNKVIPQPAVAGQTLQKILVDNDSNHSTTTGEITTGNTYTVAGVKAQFGIPTSDSSSLTFNDLSNKYIGFQFTNQTYWFYVN
ncbi:MAG: cell wall-binding repeat-containing protein [Desulfosporosinus sp.]|jgi:putative cell wall-binding protein